MSDTFGPGFDGDRCKRHSEQACPSCLTYWARDLERQLREREEYLTARIANREAQIEAHKRTLEIAAAEHQKHLKALQEREAQVAAIEKELREARVDLGWFLDGQNEGAPLRTMARLDTMHRALSTPPPAALDGLLAKARGDAIEECARFVENGRFLHDDAPTARLARECAAGIRRLADAKEE
jgi:hypothetical protein